MSAPRSPTGPLRPIELASAAVLSAVAVAVMVLGSVVPYAGNVQLLCAVPFGIVAHRHRTRAVLAATAAGAVLTFLIVGVGGAIGLISYAFIGGLVGALKRRGNGIRSILLVAAIMGPLAGALADLVLLIFSSYRELVLQTARSMVEGATRPMRSIRPLRPTAEWLDRATATLLDHWALTIGVGVGVVLVPGSLLIAWYLLANVIDRLSWAPSVDRLADAAPTVGRGDEARPPAPLPITLTGVGYRYPGAAADALNGIDLELRDGQFVALVGDNGSGKSTLARILAGVPPTSGVVHRAGSAALGSPGGTAMIMQRPDAQVLGLRVADDVRWGLPPDHDVDVEQLLGVVGLGGIGEQDTSTLSGGQLQRLAVAAALARQPRLLISDESTAMIDSLGRAELIRLLADLPRRWPVTVVHVTHSLAEAQSADRIVRLDAGRVIEDRVVQHGTGPDGTAQDGTGPDGTAQNSTAQNAAAAGPPDRTPLAAPSPREPSPMPLLVLRGVRHAYGYGTPWEHVALEGLDLDIHAGEGVLIVGDNGSGKTTLAWIMAGLQRPTEGDCLLDGRPAHRQRGAVGLAFQHARLQTQRPTVASDIRDAAGWLSESDVDRRVASALRQVGLPTALAPRPIDQLSGGQLRRVAIAGLLGREPRVLVLDEPLAGLDAPGRDALVELLTRLRRERGLTVVVVSHDTEGLSEVCPRTVRLGRGRIAEDSATRRTEAARA